MSHYTLSTSVSGVIHQGGNYKEIESSSDFTDEDCGAYCYLDNITPCRAYYVSSTKCHLLNLESGVSDSTDNQVIRYSSGSLFSLILTLGKVLSLWDSGIWR